MQLSRTAGFRRRFRKLSSSQQAAVESALRRFAADPADPRLRLHKLSGALDGQWAFSAGYDLRIVCLIERDMALLLTVGDHNEVY